MPDLGRGICTNATGETTAFRNYLDTCRTLNDRTRVNNFFDNLPDKMISEFQTLRANIDNSIIVGEQTASVLTMTGATVRSADRQITDLRKQEKEVDDNLEALKRQADQSDKTFLEKVYFGQPQKTEDATLQDIALFSFFLGWMILGFTFIVIRAMSPGGSFLSSLILLIVFILITVCVLGILLQIA